MKNWKTILLILPISLFLLYFFYIPLGSIVKIALLSPPEIWNSTFSNPLFLRFFQFTISQTILTIFGSLLIGVPTGYLLARTDPYFIKFLRAAITVPFIVPPLVILLGFVVIFERNGMLAQVITNWQFTPFSFWGIVLAHIMYNISVMARISESAFQNEPLWYHNLADTLGASKFYKFKTITLHHIRPFLVSAILLVSLYSFNSFAIVLILGEVRLQTIEVMIYSQSRLRFNFEQAAILAFFQLLINLAIIIAYTNRSKQTKYDEFGDSVPRSNKKLISTIALLLVILFTWAPIIAVFKLTISGIITAPDFIQSQILSTNYDRYLGTSSLRVIANSLFFAVLVSSFSVIFSVFYTVVNMIWKSTILEKIFSTLVILPMGTSAITLSFALLLTHGSRQYFSELVWVFILAAHLIAAMPFAFSTIFASWKTVPQEMLLISETLGANFPHMFRTVVLPYIKAGLFVAFLFSFAISLGEFGATFYLTRGEWTTLSLAIDRLFASRNTLLPNLYASLLVLFGFIVFWVIERVGTLELKL